MPIGLILGGARSGKSQYAQRLARELSPNPVYLATSRRWDDDHSARIARHQRERGPEWRTLEVDKEISRIDLARGVIVVDCVTLWLTNYFVDLQQDPDRALIAAQAEFERATLLDHTWILVSNELGQGPHATTEAGRKFTDVQGFMNQAIAARADWVVLMVAGLPMMVKGTPPGGRK